MNSSKNCQNARSEKTGEWSNIHYKDFASRIRPTLFIAVTLNNGKNSSDGGKADGAMSNLRMNLPYSKTNTCAGQVEASLFTL